MALEGPKQERWRGASMDRILRDLAGHEGSDEQYVERFRDYVIEGEITAEHLRQLTDLPVEISITEEKGRLVLGIGNSQEPHAEWDDQTQQRLLFSRLSFHTHPDSDGEIYDTPSYGDLTAAVQRGKDLPPMIIAHSKGVLLFSLGPEDREKLGTVVFDNDSDMHPTATERAMAERSGAIIFRTTWDDEAGLEQILKMFRDAVKG